MNAADVVESLTLLESAVVHVWVDGGWGVDALLGEVGREHADLDLVIHLDGGDQRQPDGGVFHYPPPVVGVVGERQVRCVDVQTQVLSHLGYEPTDTDRSDLRRLHERFGIVLPGPYRPA